MNIRAYCSNGEATRDDPRTAGTTSCSQPRALVLVSARRPYLSDLLVKSKGGAPNVRSRFIDVDPATCIYATPFPRCHPILMSLMLYRSMD